MSKKLLEGVIENLQPTFPKTLMEGNMEKMVRAIAAECEATIDDMISDPGDYGWTEKDVEGLEDNYEELIRSVGERLSKFSLGE